MRGKCFYDNKYIDIDGARAEYKTMVMCVAQKQENKQNKIN